MAGRRQGITADVTTLTARIPWWVGVVLAALSFAALLVAGASLLQWLVPALFLAAAAVSALEHRRRASLHGGLGGARRALAEKSWPEVAELVGEYFRRRDFSLTETHPAPDGAIDLILTRRGEYFLVQCRHWRTPTVGLEAVREFGRVMAARHAAGGFVVTGGTFSEEARKFAEGREIELISGERLAAAIASL